MVEAPGGRQDVSKLFTLGQGRDTTMNPTPCPDSAKWARETAALYLSEECSEQMPCKQQPGRLAQSPHFRQKHVWTTFLPGLQNNNQHNLPVAPSLAQTEASRLQDNLDKPGEVVVEQRCCRKGHVLRDQGLSTRPQPFLSVIMTLDKSPHYSQTQFLHF